MGKCDLCQKGGDNLSILSANHKDQGWIGVCRDCWVVLYSENRMVADSGSSGKESTPSCGSCSNCGLR